ncbi:MAG TPA: SDR family oxidoreductase [Limnochordia bacterium]|nr:SDR family oxidoreductase [Limnochordia bacterium]
MPFTADTFAGKRALVTGSSRGTGRLIALTLARHGADVIVSYKANAEMAQKVVDEIKAMGRDAIAIGADQEDPRQIEALFNEIDQTYGELDIFVANAAATAFKSTMELKEHHIDRTFGLNVRGFVLAAQGAARLMDGRGGRIVAISGYGSIRVLPGYAALGSAKAAIEQWVKYLAVELAPKGIHVNGINPGLLITDSSDVFFGRSGAAEKEHVIGLTPQQRATDPQAVADLTAFLCSPLAEYICGQTIVVDAGLTLVAPPYPGEWVARLSGSHGG